MRKKMLPAFIACALLFTGCGNSVVQESLNNSGLFAKSAVVDESEEISGIDEETDSEEAQKSSSSKKTKDKEKASEPVEDEAEEETSSSKKTTDVSEEKEASSSKKTKDDSEEKSSSSKKTKDVSSKKSTSASSDATEGSDIVLDLSGEYMFDFEMDGKRFKVSYDGELMSMTYVDGQTVEVVVNDDVVFMEATGQKVKSDYTNDVRDSIADSISNLFGEMYVGEVLGSTDDGASLVTVVDSDDYVLFDEAEVVLDSKGNVDYFYASDYEAYVEVSTVDVEPISIDEDDYSYYSMPEMMDTALQTIADALGGGTSSSTSSSKKSSSAEETDDDEYVYIPDNYGDYEDYHVETIYKFLLDSGYASKTTSKSKMEDICNSTSSDDYYAAFNSLVETMCDELEEVDYTEITTYDGDVITVDDMRKTVNDSRSLNKLVDVIDDFDMGLYDSLDYDEYLSIRDVLEASPEEVSSIGYDMQRFYED